MPLTRSGYICANSNANPACEKGWKSLNNKTNETKQNKTKQKTSPVWIIFSSFLLLVPNPFDHYSLLSTYQSPKIHRGETLGSTAIRRALAPMRAQCPEHVCRGTEACASCCCQRTARRDQCPVDPTRENEGMQGNEKK
jgi:hypothetical protein